MNFTGPWTITLKEPPEGLFFRFYLSGTDNSDGLHSMSSLRGPTEYPIDIDGESWSIRFEEMILLAPAFPFGRVRSRFLDLDPRRRLFRSREHGLCVSYREDRPNVEPWELLLVSRDPLFAPPAIPPDFDFTIED